MGCEYCHWTSGHPSSCPNADEPKSDYQCSFCEEGIYEGEEYVINQDGDYAHLDCVDATREVISWFGSEIKTIEGDNY